METKHASIIVVHYAHTDDFSNKNKLRGSMMQRCIDSLNKNTDYLAELIVLDNGGNPDDSQELLDMNRVGKIQTYVRYSNNMHFAFAWNQGLRLATGKYVVLTCNDIEFKPKWLSVCIALLEKNPERKLIATPFLTPDKNRWNFNKEVLADGSRINSLAGSNCMVLKRETLMEIGEFPHHRIAGTIWHRRMNRLGYMVIIPPEDLAVHLAFRSGVDWKKQISVKRKMLNGEEVDFHYQNYLHGKLYRGKQIAAGWLIKDGVAPWYE